MVEPHFTMKLKARRNARGYCGFCHSNGLIEIFLDAHVVKEKGKLYADLPELRSTIIHECLHYAIFRSAPRNVYFSLKAEHKIIDKMI